MKTKFTHRLVAFAFWGGLILSNSLHAQQTGEVKDQEFIIRKDRVLTLPQKSRRFEKLPTLPTPSSNTSFSYEPKTYTILTQPSEINATAAQKQFPLKKEELFPGFARVGYGNYSSPILEGRYNLWEDGDYAVGAYVKHEGFYTGPIAGRNSGENFTNIKADGNLYKDFFQLYGGVSYDRHRLNFYGYDPEDLLLVDFIPNQNTLQTFQVQAGISDLDKLEGLNYDAKIGIRGFNDQYQAAETEVLLGINTDYWLNEQMFSSIDLDLSLTRPRDEFYSDINRNYFGIRPSFEYKDEHLELKIGANIIIENDISPNKRSDFHVYPDIYAGYQIQDEIGAFVSFAGDVQRKTYLDFVNENPFLGPSTTLLNTIQRYKVTAGAKGTLVESLTYEAGFSFGRFRNMHFFNTAVSDSLRFEILFDGETQVLNYFAKVGYKQGDWYFGSFGVDYFQYTTSELQAAFHRPSVELKWNNNFRPTEQWLIQMNVLAMGGIQVADVGSDDITTLPTVLDLQVKADYKITERISAFAVGNNLLNRTNQRFINYPVRGIQGILGATFKF
ncbi:TonB-dependent receptor [Mongoliitalea daihaiensis]|uniref:TonB-dependent receptor n=1 Tax=Mongoliitalea daihaiensis TaxID=2782006 RepID=UPI001F176943|nr:TonB-dependent receptor [Mongoliitalea daihaiensis]UJP64284.1 TonB-dependent receptor [Mongoliitalea daihaiensis]